MTTANEEPGLMDVPRKMARWAMAVIGIVLILVLAVFLLQPEPIRAAREGNYKAIESLVRRDPGIVNRQIDGVTTLLYVAAYWNQPEIVKLLIDSGANPDLGAGRSEISRPVHAAARQGSARVMKRLADAGADLNVPGGWTSEPPIMTAASEGYLDVVKVLLDEGVDPSTQVVRTHSLDPDSEYVETTLGEAAREGHADIVELLLEHGAAVTYMDGDHLETELRQFCLFAPEPKYDAERYPEWLSAMPRIVDLLVEKLGDVIFRHDQTILHSALGDDHPGKFAIARHLIEHHPVLDVNAVNFLWETPLHKAVSARNVAGVKYLLENCPELNVNLTEEASGHTPLKAAESYLGHIPLMEFLDEDEIEHQQEQLRQIIKLLKAHGGRVDKEQERRVRERVKRLNENK